MSSRAAPRKSKSVIVLPACRGFFTVPRRKDCQQFSTHLVRFTSLSLDRLTRMHVRALSAISAEPILGLVRAHARRTALGRLAVVYNIVPSPSSRPAVVLTDPADKLVLNPFGPKVLAMLPLGQALFADSIIEGGIDGEVLPMTIDRGVQLNMTAHEPGALLNLVG
jgi:hypothetical protein